MAIKIRCGERQKAIPPGEYRAKATDISEGTFVGKRRTLMFFFEIVEGEWKGEQVRSFVNAHYESFSQFTKLRQWIDRVARVDTEPGEEINLDLFYGKVLRVKVESKKSRKTGNEFSNVTDIMGVVCDLGLP